MQNMQLHTETLEIRDTDTVKPPRALQNFLEDVRGIKLKIDQLVITSTAVITSAPALAAIIDKSPVPVPISRTLAFLPLSRIDLTAILIAL